MRQMLHFIFLCLIGLAGVAFFKGRQDLVPVLVTAGILGFVASFGQWMVVRTVHHRTSVPQRPVQAAAQPGWLSRTLNKASDTIARNWRGILGVLFMIGGALTALSASNLFGTHAFERFVVGILLFLIGAMLLLAEFGTLESFARWWGKEMGVYTVIGVSLLVAAYAVFAHSESGLPALEDPWILVFLGALGFAFLVTLHTCGLLGIFLKKTGSALLWALTTTPIAFFTWGVSLAAGAVWYVSNGGEEYEIATWVAAGGIVLVIGGLLSLGKDAAKHLREK